MARLLRNQDYYRAIKSDTTLQQVVSENWQATKDFEQAAQKEMIGYLTQRYEVGEIFTNTTVFSITAVYSAKNLVYLDASAYSASSTYALGDMVLQSGNVYYCATAITVAEAFTVGKWTLLGAQYAWFYVTVPAAEYDPTTTYAVGNEIFYKNKTYTCLIACTNILPTEAAFWGTGTTYTVTGVWPTDATKWSEGDNRDPLIVMYLLDITLFHLFATVPPRNIPDLRKERYNGNSPTDSGGAIGWLKRVASGDVTADLPNKIPQQGMSIRYGNANGVNSDGTTTISKNMMW